MVERLTEKTIWEMFMRLDFAYDLTEQNFHKAYDECVRLFTGE